MTERKAVLAFLLLLGLVPVTLSGCRDCMIVHAKGASGAGPLHISKMGGDIDVPAAPDGAHLSTMGGSIHVGSVGSFAKLHTMGGDISVEHANASVDASTMGGKITIKDTNGSIKASTMAGDVSAHVVGSSTARRDIELSSKSGTIVLNVPKDFPMEIRVILAYTKNAGDHFRIINSLGLSQQESQEWDNSHGTPRKYIRATGRVGSGLNHVTIDTINGDVILRQE